MSAEDHILTAHSSHQHLVGVLHFGHAQRMLCGQEVVTQHTLGELMHAERVEAPVDGMPTLKSVVGRYEYRVGTVVHYLCEIAFG